jgi:hypothetical protein
MPSPENVSTRKGIAMSDLGRPFVFVWKYADDVGGFPGRALLIVGTIMLIIGVLTWLGNKK